MKELFAVIDTETNWNDEVMSIGIVISSFKDFKIIYKAYYIIEPEVYYGGMYHSQLVNEKVKGYYLQTREKAMYYLKELLKFYKIKHIFAYNANFDYRHLKELSDYIWVDIMKIAAYRQYNDKLPKSADYCVTGRLRTGYGVEHMYVLLSGKDYTEYHNAICDAEDELEIMKMLNKGLSDYEVAIIN